MCVCVCFCVRLSCTYHLSRFAGFTVIIRIHACDRTAKDFLPLRNVGSVVLNKKYTVYVRNKVHCYTVIYLSIHIFIKNFYLSINLNNVVRKHLDTTFLKYNNKSFCRSTAKPTVCNVQNQHNRKRHVIYLCWSYSAVWCYDQGYYSFRVFICISF